MGCWCWFTSLISSPTKRAEVCIRCRFPPYRHSDTFVEKMNSLFVRLCSRIWMNSLHILSAFYKLNTLHTEIKNTTLSNVCAWVFQKQLNKTTTQLRNIFSVTLLPFLPAWKRPDDNNVYWSPIERCWPLLLHHLPPSIPPPPCLWKASTCLWLMPVVWRWVLHIKASGIMGCFKYCSLKTVADKMTAAIFILVREQGHLVGS